MAIVLCCGALFVHKLLPSSSEKDSNSLNLNEKSTLGSSQKGQTSDHQNRASNDSDLSKDNVENQDHGIPFPENLLTELEKEMGIEAKEDFLNEWKTLSDDERKSYLMDIGVWHDENHSN